MSKKSFDPRKIPGWNRLEYLALRSLAGLVNALPIEASTAIARVAGDILYWALADRRRSTHGNLDLAFRDSLSRPQKSRIVRESFRNLATSLMEFFRTPAMVREAEKRFELEGTEVLDAAFARGKGAIFVISHLGSWEYLAFMPYLKKYNCCVVVRPTKNPYIYKWIQDLRRSTNLEPIDRTGAARQVLQRLRENWLVSILIDQWAGAHGLWIDFFGEPTSTTSLPARLHLRSGAALVPGYCLRVAPGRYKITIRPEIPVEPGDDHTAVTKKLNAALEQEIRRHPEQWTWTHRRWKGEARYRTLRAGSAS